MKTLFEEAQKRVKAMGEEQLLAHFSHLSEEAQKALLLAIEKINPPLLQEQKALLNQPPKIPSHYSPASADVISGNRESGLSLLQNGQVGALLLAGGMGTRLGWEGPKGTYPITLIRKKSLFQLFAERTLFASKLANRELPLAIMTSSRNDEETRTFFRKNGYFGLREEQVDFFVQDNLPFLDREGHLFLTKGGTLAQGPDGNGDALFSRTFPLLEKMGRQKDRICQCNSCRQCNGRAF